jgi:hypothetical protein
MIDKSGFDVIDNLPHTFVWQTLVISCITPIKFNWLKIWSDHKFVSWHDVWTLFGVVHFAYMCSTRLISCLYLLCAHSVVNPLLNCSNLIQLATMSYFVSFDHFEHLLALVFVDMYTWQHQLEHLFNLFAIILKLLHLCIYAFIACFEGGLHSLGSNLISAYVNKGEKFPHSQYHKICIHLSEIAFVQGELHLICFC